MAEILTTFWASFSMTFCAVVTLRYKIIKFVVLWIKLYEQEVNIFIWSKNANFNVHPTILLAYSPPILIVGIVAFV